LYNGPTRRVWGQNEKIVVTYLRGISVSASRRRREREQCHQRQFHEHHLDPPAGGTTQGEINSNLTENGWTGPNGLSSYVFVFNSGASAMSGVTGQFGGLSLWGTGNSGPDTIVNSPDGGNFIGMDADFSGHMQPIEQVITGLTTGKTYTVTFDYAFAQQYSFNGATNQAWVVDLSGDPSQQTPSSLYNLPQHTFSGWFSDTITFVAQGSTEMLSFIATGSPAVPPFALLDGVTFSQESAVPEPSTWAMMLVGFSGLGFAGYRRARKRAAAPEAA
jgi:hypothetical protein